MMEQEVWRRPANQPGDCIAGVPVEEKDAVAAVHGNRAPPDTPVDPGELV
jgi:hypothetical protein